MGRLTRDEIGKSSSAIVSMTRVRIGIASSCGGTAGVCAAAPIGPSPRHCLALTPPTHVTLAGGGVGRHFEQRSFLIGGIGSEIVRDLAQQQLAVSRPHGVAQPHA